MGCKQGKVFVQRLTIPVRQTVSNTVNQLRIVHFGLVLSIFLNRLVDLITVVVDE